ncbi:MAG: aKG-HExxH-type peptide beta-hydroxylase [Pseudonocardiaceae bacterium]
MTPFDVIDKGMFDACPDGARMPVLRTAVNSNLHRDLLDQAEIAAKVLPGTAGRVRPLIECLDVTRRVDPMVFTCHHQLATGLRSQDVARVATALGALSRLLEERPYSDTFSVGSVLWDAVDAELLAFLCGPEGPRTPKGEYPEVWAPHHASLTRGTDWVDRSLPLLAELDPQLHAEFHSLVGSLRLFRGRAVRGMTSVRCFGLMLLRLPDPGPEAEEPLLYFLDHITHETSHLVLHTLMNVDPLITNGHAERFDAPIRPDPRPLYGIYHATFVLSRITRVLARLAKRDPRSPILASRDLQHARFRKGAATITRHAHLTPLGKQVLDSCGELVDHEMG